MAPLDLHREEYLVKTRELFTTHKKSQNRVYISRKNATHRKLLNEDKVESLLEDYGFKTVQAESLSFKEQVLLFSSCSHLITNYGSGLSNVLFMQNNAKVLELRKIVMDCIMVQLKKNHQLFTIPIIIYVLH